MPYSESQNKATQKYHKEHLDQLAIRIPKGKREKYKEYAKRKNKSLAGLIVELIEREMENNP